MMNYWTLPAVAAMLAVGVQPALANSNKGENIGVGVGAIVGAAAGGPVGFLVGVIGGAKIGERIDDQADTNAQLSTALADSEGYQGSLERNIAELQDDLASVESSFAELRDGRHATTVALLEKGLRLNVSFASDEFEPGARNQSQLLELGEVLSGIPDARIELHGYADATGGERYNQMLSMQRAQSVRDILLAAGVHADAMELTAHGQASMPGSTRQDLAEDRRVSLVISLPATADAAVAGL